MDMAFHGHGNDSYSLHWRQLASSNADVYDEVDGDASVYKCRTLSEFRNAMIRYQHRSIHDDRIQEIMSRIKGHLVHWPMDFLNREDLSPAVTTKAFIPLDLWV